MQRFKEHGFFINSIDEFTEHSKALDEVLKKLDELKKRNSVLVHKYKGDAKFARVHAGYKTLSRDEKIKVLSDSL